MHLRSPQRWAPRSRAPRAPRYQNATRARRPCRNNRPSCSCARRSNSSRRRRVAGQRQLDGATAADRLAAELTYEHLSWLLAQAEQRHVGSRDSCTTAVAERAAARGCRLTLLSSQRRAACARRRFCAVNAQCRRSAECRRACAYARSYAVLRTASTCRRRFALHGFGTSVRASTGRCKRLRAISAVS